MTFTDKLLSVVIGGLVIWGAKNIIIFIIQRYRLGAAMILEIEVYQRVVRESLNYFNELFSNVLVEGRKLNYPIQYYREEFNFFNSQRPILHEYFSRRILIKIMKFYNRLWEFESILEAFFTSYNFLVEKGGELNQDNVSYMQKRMDRIITYNALINRNVRRLKDLPDDYAEIMGPTPIDRQ